MSNNKQNHIVEANKMVSSIDWLFPKVLELTLQLSNKRISQRSSELKILELFEQAKAQHKKESIVFALLCMMPNMEPHKSTIATISNIYDEYFNK